MPLNAGDAGCGAAPGPKLAAGAGLSESSPLLVPDHEPEPVHRWKPLTTAELEVAAGGPGWRKIRRYLLAGFWLAWAAMLAGSVAVVATSPRPVSASLTWWQKSLFYQVQPDLWVAKEDGPGGVSALCDQLPYLKALSAGALILEGLFEDRRSPFHLSPTDEFRSRVAQIQHLLTESNRMGLKVVLDICDVNTTGNADESSNHSTSVLQNHISLVFAAYLHYQLVPLILKHANICQQDALLFWLERGVAGFAICDTDAAYSEQVQFCSSICLLTLFSNILHEKFITDPVGVEEHLKEVQQGGGEVVFSLLHTLCQQAGNNLKKHLDFRILVVKQKGEVLSPLNATLVDVVMRSILPSSPKRLSAAEVRDAIKEHLQREDDDVWIGWTAGGKVPQDLKKLLLVLMMTLPGSPAVQYEEVMGQTQGGHASHGVNGTDATPDQDRRSALALLTSLSNSRSREEALLFGSFFLLPFNSSSPPVLAFLRSWGCVHFLVLVNLGPELCAVDAAWAPSLPSTGVFVASTETGRLGSTTLDELHLQPREAVVIKLLEAGSYS